MIKHKTPKGVWPIQSDLQYETKFALVPTKLTNGKWIWLKEFIQEYQMNPFVDGYMYKDVYRRWV